MRLGREIDVERLAKPSAAHTLTVPHPIWGKDEDKLRALARSVLDKAMAELLP